MGNSKDNHWSEHGLGHLLNPSNLQSDDRDWTAHVWKSIICNSLNRPAAKVGFENVPAISRLTITSPAILEALAGLNSGKPYCDQIKPFNFLLTCHVSPFGHPPGVNPERFHLIAPFELNPAKWLQIDWIDQYSGHKFRITTDKYYRDRDAVRVKTYGEVFAEYAHHPESKCADEYGITCDRPTRGLLNRRRVGIGEIIFIGKESNRLEEVDAGLVHSPDSVYTTYPDLTRDSWERTIRPKMQAIPLSVLIRETDMSRRALINIRRGRTRPHLRNQTLIAKVVERIIHKE